MIREAIIDTGPLISLIDRRDAHHEPNAVVFTLDGDFHIYRRNKRQRIPLLMPPDL